MVANKCKHQFGGTCMARHTFCMYMSDPQSCLDYVEEFPGPYKTPSAAEKKAEKSEVAELQSRIAKGTIAITKLAEAIDGLPDSDTKTGLIEKHDKLLANLEKLQGELLVRDIHACIYGVAGSCSKPSKGVITCSECLLGRASNPKERG